jgi:hypothetical protein
MNVPRRDLIDALKETFPLNNFDNMLSTRLNRNREWIIAGAAGASLVDIVTAVVLRAEKQGWVRELVHGALAEAPAAPHLLAFIQKYPRFDPANAQAPLDCYRAIFLKSQRVFLKRDELREKLQIIGSPNESRVMAIDGGRGFGKTYSKEFLYFLKENESSWAGFVQMIVYVYMDQCVFQPEELARVLGSRLGLDERTVPPNKGEQDARRIPDLVDWLREGIENDDGVIWWLVLDGFRVQVQPEATHDLIRALIDTTDSDWGNARLILLDYGKFLDLDTTLYILCETISPIERHDVEDFFEHVYSRSQKTWKPEDIRQTVDDLLAQVDAEVAKRGPEVRLQILSTGLTRAAKNLLR